MPLPTGNVLGILADNLEKRKGAVPFSPGKATAWAEGLDIKNIATEKAARIAEK